MPAPDSNANDKPAADVKPEAKPETKPAAKKKSAAKGGGAYEPNDRGLVAVKLLAHFRKYNAGETVGVKPHEAKRLCESDPPAAELVK